MKAGLKQFVAERKKPGQKCRVCALPKPLLAEITEGRLRDGVSYAAIEAYLMRKGFKLYVATHFKRHISDEANGG